MLIAAVTASYVCYYVKDSHFKILLFLVIELINECENGVDDCSINAMCTDAKYLYTCTCNDGYSGNGKTCTGMWLIYLHMLLVNIK